MHLATSETIQTAVNSLIEELLMLKTFFSWLGDVVVSKVGKWAWHTAGMGNGEWLLIAMHARTPPHYNQDNFPWVFG